MARIRWPGTAAPGHRQRPVVPVVVSCAHALGDALASPGRSVAAGGGVVPWPGLADDFQRRSGCGIGPREWVLNAQVAASYSRMDPAAHIAELAGGLGLGGEGVRLLTAASVADMVQCEDDRGACPATVGLRIPVWAAAPPGGAEPVRGGSRGAPAAVHGRRRPGLDQTSELMLTFVARRLLAEPVGILFAAREPSGELQHLPELEVRGVDGDGTGRSRSLVPPRPDHAAEVLSCSETVTAYCCQGRRWVKPPPGRPWPSGSRP